MRVVVQTELGAQGCKRMASEIGPYAARDLEGAQVADVGDLEIVIPQKACEHADIESGVVGHYEVIADEVEDLGPDVFEIGGIGHIARPYAVYLDVPGIEVVMPFRGLYE